MKFMRKIILILVIAAFFPLKALYPQNDPFILLCQEIQQTTKFKPEEVKKLTGLIETARKEGVEFAFLEKRVREGLAKKVRFKALYVAVQKKVDFHKISKSLIDDYTRLNMKCEDMNYSVENLSVMMENGLTEQDFRAIANLSLMRKLKMEDSLDLCKIYLTRGLKKNDKLAIIYGLLEEKKLEEIKSKFR